MQTTQQHQIPGDERWSQFEQMTLPVRDWMAIAQVLEVDGRRRALESRRLFQVIAFEVYRLAEQHGKKRTDVVLRGMPLKIGLILDEIEWMRNELQFGENRSLDPMIEALDRLLSRNGRNA